MKKLNDIIKGLSIKQIVGSGEVEIDNLTYDSRTVKQNSLFFATIGVATDGHNYIQKAIEGGAVAVICQTLPQNTETATFIQVEDSTKAMAIVAEQFYDNPSHHLKVVGVTGTNGKTTIATLLYDSVRAMGYKAGLISTVVYKINDVAISSTHTTPDSIRIAQMMAQMVEAGCQYCFMECSSHAIVQNRIYGIDFDGALFTNLTHDHLDYHKTFAEYLKAKKRFFDDLPKHAFAVVNADDKNGTVMLQNTAAKKYTLSLNRLADFNAKIIETDPSGMQLRIAGKDIWVQFLGSFNASNLLTVYAALVLLGFEEEEVLRIITTLHSVAGRFEPVRAKNGTIAIIDYAHTPDALENVLKTIAQIRQKGQKIIVVCGCGGDRDRTKRPEMAAIAVANADRVIFTSDNPRTEDPEQILKEMEQGVQPTDNYLKIVNREEAIRSAVMLSAPKDIILIAGKGHEDYQIIGTTKHHFNDKEEVQKWFDAIIK